MWRTLMKCVQYRKKLCALLCALLVILIGLTGIAWGEGEDVHAEAESGGSAGTQEAPSSAADDPTAVEPQETASDPDAEHGSSEEAAADEPAARPESEAVRWDGVLRPGEACGMTVRESRLYRLTLPEKTGLLLEVSGVPVRVTVTALRSGLTRAWESAADEDPHRFVIREAMTLERGEYSVTVELLREELQGAVSLCFTAPEAAEGTEEDLTAETADAMTEEDTAEADTAADEDDGTGSEETADPAETSDPPAAEPLTVRVLVSCEEGLRPGATVVLTAVVSDPDYRGTIHWQYSADGGQTVCEAEGAEGAEYRFTLDEVNRTYWWRAYLE